MSNLRAFLKQNKKETKNIKFVASERFTDENENPVEWEIKPVSSRRADVIREECTTVKGKNIKVDSKKFNRMLAVECTVFPDLNDKDLQDSYGVMGAEQLIQELLDVDGEYQGYLNKILEVCGYTKSEQELVDEAKN
jgi:hypothetical protein